MILQITQNAWQMCLNICHITKGAHVEICCGRTKNNGYISLAMQFIKCITLFLVEIVTDILFLPPFMFNT